jgi:transposase
MTDPTGPTPSNSDCLTSAPMGQKSETRQTGAAKAIKDICRATRKQYSAEEKIRIVLDGLRGEETIAELCRREGIAQSIYYKWSKEFWKLASAGLPAIRPVLLLLAR